MKALRNILIVLIIIVVGLVAVFFAGRYGWKLGGFRACQSAGITSVEVHEQTVHITGSYLCSRKNPGVAVFYPVD